MIIRVHFLQNFLVQRKNIVRKCSRRRATSHFFDAGWKVEELKRLVDTCQELIAAVSGVIQVIDNPTTDMIQANIAGRLGSVRESLSSFTRDLSRHQRIAYIRLHDQC